MKHRESRQEAKHRQDSLEASAWPEFEHDFGQTRGVRMNVAPKVIFVKGSNSHGLARIVRFPICGNRPGSR